MASSDVLKHSETFRVMFVCVRVLPFEVQNILDFPGFFLDLGLLRVTVSVKLPPPEALPPVKNAGSNRP